MWSASGHSHLILILPYTAMKLHPLSQVSTSRIDMLYGGSADEVFEETVTIARQVARRLKDPEERVMYINTIDGPEAIEEQMARLRKRDSDRIFRLTATPETFSDKLEYARICVKNQKVKLIIMNSFEFAAMTPRHRSNVLVFLHWAKTKLRCRIVVVTMRPPTKVGTIGQLRYIARSAAEIGAWLRDEEQGLPAAVEEQPTVVLQKEAIGYGYTVKPIEEPDRRSDVFDDDVETTTDPESSHEPHEMPLVDKTPLKNKDLVSENVSHTPTRDDGAVITSDFASQRMAA